MAPAPPQDADGIGAAGSALVAAPDSAALLSPAPVDGFPASSARTKNPGTKKMANAVVAINLALDLIVAS
jgi:hypothetical protein